MDRKSFYIDLAKLQEAKSRNNNQLKECLLSERSNECNDMNECLKINEELDREIQKLMVLKRKYNLTDLLEPDDMYLLDPSRPDCKSKHVDYHPRMFNIDLGVPSCATAGCNTTSDDIFRINPNVKDNWLPDEEQFMLAPKSNQLISKWELDQKQKMRIYPHMFGDHIQLMKESQRPFKGGIERGGIDYPIPMRYQLRYLQQPKSNASQNIDYDIHIKRKDKNLPEFHDFIVDEDLTIRNAEVQRCNRQRGIVDKKMVYDSRLEKSFDKLHQGELTYRDEIRKTVGKNQPSQQYLENVQCQREKSFAKEVRDQPLYSQRYKGIPRYAQTISTRGNGSESFGLQGTESISIKRQTGPSQEATGPSGFFALGPPLPPPNPELLSAIDPSLLVHYTQFAQPKDDRHLDVTIQKPTTQQDLRCRNESPLLTDLDETLNPLRVNDSSTQLFSPQGGGIETFIGGGTKLDITNDITFEKQTPKTVGNNIFRNNLIRNSSKSIDSEEQLLPQYLSGESPPDYEKALLAKDLAFQRIKYQMAHLDRLEPILRQKQIQSKEKNRSIEINKLTLYMDRVQHVRKRLRLMTDRISEEREELLELLSKKLTPNQLQKLLQQSDDFLKEAGKNSQHFFHKMAQGVGLFYTEQNFQGEEHELAYGFHNFPEVGGVGNNKLASFKIPKNTRLVLYEHPDRQGTSITYIGPKRIQLLPSRYRNRISGIDLIADKPPYEAHCYTNKFYQGNLVKLKIGFYDYPLLGGVGPKGLRSFKLPSELIMTVYSRPEKRGEKITYIGPYELPFFNPDWDKNVSGIELQLK